MHFETQCVLAVQGHTKVVDFGTNRKRVCDFVLVINSNLGPIIIASFQRYYRLFVENSDPTPIPPELWGVPLDYTSLMFGLRGEKTLR